MRTNSTIAPTNTQLGQHNPFDILIHADGVDLTEKLREAVNTKIGRVRQYAPRALRARVRLTQLLGARSQNQFRARVLYEVPGNDVSAEHVAHEPLAALDIVAEKIERRLRKRKTARLARRTRGEEKH
jgi:putative sigma-54 modulation protein